MKTFKIIIDTDGTSNLELRGYEEESPQVARAFEKGTVDRRDWRPGNHAHVHLGHGHKH